MLPGLGMSTRSRTRIAHEPQLPRVYARRDLFRVLDRASKQRLVWVQGPPGSGKTVLVASWLKARDRPRVWISLDAAEGDEGGLVRTLAVALGAQTPPPDTSLRRRLNRLWVRLRGASVVVLDGVERIPIDAPAQAVLREAILSLPQGSVLVATSREAPPPAAARAIAEGQVAVIGWDLLRLSLAEAR